MEIQLNPLCYVTILLTFASWLYFIHVKKYRKNKEFEKNGEKNF